MPVRILHILHSFSAGGLENGVVHIINGSPAHLEHELCFLTRGGEFLQRLNRPVPYHEFHKEAGRDLRLILKIASHIRERRVDIVHTRNWAAFDGFMAACLNPGVALIHGEHGRDMGDPEGLNRRRNLLRRGLAFRARKFVAVSTDLCRWLSQTVGISKEKILHIPNGVDTTRFLPNRNRDLRCKLGIAPNEFVVGTISRLDPVKNQEGLIRAVESINQGSNKVRLVMVGDGPHLPVLKGLIEQKPFSPSPILAGYDPRPEDYYGIFDLFALNSFAEGMSNTLMEAMASGLPIVCTPVGANSELVVDGVNGTHVRVGDYDQLAQVIAGFASNREMGRRFGIESRALIERRFSLSAMLQGYNSLYESTAALSVHPAVKRCDSLAEDVKEGKIGTAE